MTKKDLRSVAASLSAVAASLPTQNVRPAAAGHPGPVLAPVPSVALAPVSASVLAPVEPLVQFSFGLRKSQRRALQRLASDADMTMRAFILDALKARGLEVTEEDLLDLRRKG